MALPKRRHSNQRTLKRRTHWVLKGPTLGKCQRCDRPKPTHSACPSCGFYAGRKTIEVEE